LSSSREGGLQLDSTSGPNPATVAVHYIIPREHSIVYRDLVEHFAKPLDAVQQNISLLHNSVISCTLGGGTVGFDNPMNAVHNAVQSTRGNEMD